jgi:hypothetical protein
MREHLNEKGRLVCNVQMNSTSPIGIASRIANRLPWSTLRNTMSIGEQSTLLRSAGFVVEQITPYGYMSDRAPTSRPVLRLPSWLDY